jgi:hypothetical protein
MPSFALKLTNLPTFNGSDPVEATLKAAVKEATGFEPLGVSVAWNYEGHEEQVKHAIEAELDEDEKLAEHTHDRKRIWALLVGLKRQSQTRCSMHGMFIWTAMATSTVAQSSSKGCLRDWRRPPQPL